jgi:hypothetical protein
MTLPAYLLYRGTELVSVIVAPTEAEAITEATRRMTPGEWLYAGAVAGPMLYVEGSWGADWFRLEKGEVTLG